MAWGSKSNEPLNINFKILDIECGDLATEGNRGN
jgi:hypothetical protein